MIRGGPARPLAGQEEGIAGEIASLHQPREHHVQDHRRLALAGRGERAVQRAPVRECLRPVPVTPVTRTAAGGGLARKYW